jgi:hypothetical protein
MKNIITFIFGLALVLFVSCSSPQQKNAGEEKTEKAPLSEYEKLKENATVIGKWSSDLMGRIEFYEKEGNYYQVMVVEPYEPAIMVVTKEGNMYSAPNSERKEFFVIDGGKLSYGENGEMMDPSLIGDFNPLK